MGSHGRIQTFSNRDQVIDLFRGAELLINAGKKTVGSTDIGSGGNGKGKDRFGIFDTASQGSSGREAHRMKEWIY